MSPSTNFDFAHNSATVGTIALISFLLFGLSMYFGIYASLILFYLPLIVAVVGGPVAIVFGIIALYRRQGHTKLAVVGLGTGLTVSLLSIGFILFWIAWAVAWNAAVDNPSTKPADDGLRIHRIN